MRATAAVQRNDDRLDALERRLEQLEAVVTTLRSSEAISDGAFVAAVAASVEGRVFSAAELVAHSAVDGALARVVQQQTAIQMGRRLRRMMGVNYSGLAVLRVGRDRDGIVWCVVTAGLHADAPLPIDDEV